MLKKLQYWYSEASLIKNIVQPHIYTHWPEIILFEFRTVTSCDELKLAKSRDYAK